MNSIDHYINTRKRTEDICSPLKTEDYVPQPAVFASPPKWHLAHTNWFFEEMILKKFDKSYKEFHPNFGFLFNSYYNTIGERTERMNRGLITRPSVEEVYKYRTHVDKHMRILLENNSNHEINSLTTLGINHEQQHQELLLTDLKYSLSQNPIHPIYKEGLSLVKDENFEKGFVKIDEGVYEIGNNSDSFHFDNEEGLHKVYLADYEISKSLVTNGDYIEFIEDHGYGNFNYWLDEGWSWVNENKINSPLYWRKIKGEWFHFTLSGLQKVNKNEILCHISFYEANAFAAWKGMRLPTEFEWEIASEEFSWGKRWEWTNSSYLPYPGFKIADGAVGEYNGKFMVNQMVLRGGSTATADGHSRKTYRNFFHPFYQWQFSGIRLVK
ncbi:ergothioneine biosynthesis protein EgtB [Flavobacteriales bacterium]|nr:ergothioneine biosynthesis protein EgtB [Flavobacteriales bacterium]